MPSLINSKLYAFNIATEHDLSGVIHIRIYPKNEYEQPEIIRAWVTPEEAMMIQLGAGLRKLTAIFLGQSDNYPFLKWGDEIVIKPVVKGLPELDTKWLSDVMVGNIEPTPKNKPELGKLRGRSRLRHDPITSVKIGGQNSVKAKAKQSAECVKSDNNAPLVVTAKTYKISSRDIDGVKLRKILEQKVQKSIAHINFTRAKVKQREIIIRDFDFIVSQIPLKDLESFDAVNVNMDDCAISAFDI